MEQGFISIIEKMTAEQGVQVLLGGAWRKYLADYMGSQYKKETALFKQLLEEKSADYINSADNVPERKRQLLERLENDRGLSPRVTAEYLDLLGMILKGDRSKCGAQSAPPAAPPQPEAQVPAPAAWHTSRNGKDEGPFDHDALLRKALNRELTADTPVWKEGMAGWKEAGTVAELAAILAKAPPPPPIPSVPLPPKPTAPPQTQSAPDGFVNIPGGTFTMGSPANEAGRSDDEVQHQVTVSGFYMGKYEVTQSEWQEVMGNNFSLFKGAKLPVEQVSWYEAVEYCNKRSIKEGLSPAYTIDKTRKDPGNKNYDDRDKIKWLVTWNRSANGYRLPTEAEWEYACRAGTTTPYYSGKKVDSAGWYKKNSGKKTHPVGKKRPNAWGLYDMHGNVYEWCWDWYGDYPVKSETDPVGASSGAYRVDRGGSWYFSAAYARSACRNDLRPSVRNYYLGFRLARPQF